MSNYKTTLQSHNIELNSNNLDLQSIIDKANSLPDAGSSSPVLQDKTVTPTTSQQTVTADSGYDGLDAVTVDAIPTATQATPSISVSSSGLITASATQTEGYVTAGTKSGTKQLTTQAAKTITPSTSSQTAVASGRYTTGAITVAAIPSTYVKPTTTKGATTYTPTTSTQTIAAGTYCSGAQTISGDANLTPSNIKSGVSIFGVTGIADVDGVQLPELTNEGTAADLRSGKQLIDGGGNVIVGTMSSSNASASVKEVNFYDYDGTLLYSYNVEEVQILTELPPLPTHEGLTCQGWNYDLATIKSYNRAVDVGATYITDDGKTRLYIRIAAEGRMTVPLYISQTVAKGVTIDWGDGSTTQTLSGTGNRNTTHIYSSIGDYVITLDVADGCTLGFGIGSSSYCIMGLTNTTGCIYCNMLQKVEIGNSVTSIGSNAFSYCYSLASIAIPNSVTSIGNNAFPGCYSLASIIIPDGITSIGNNAFYNCYSLASIAIPNSVTSIGTYAFYNCYGMAIYDFTSHTSVPTLANTSAFNGIPSDCVIKVPAALYDEWIAATNWSTYASYIVAV